MWMAEGGAKAGHTSGPQTPVKFPCYDLGMSAETRTLLEAFDHLPAEEKRAFAHEILRRSLPFDSGPLTDEEIEGGSRALFRSLDEEDGDSATR